MKPPIPAPTEQQLEQLRRREALLAGAASIPLPPREGELPLENYEKELMARDRTARLRKGQTQD
jgi:hypothetical protein